MIESAMLHLERAVASVLNLLEWEHDQPPLEAMPEALKSQAKRVIESRDELAEKARFFDLIQASCRSRKSLWIAERVHTKLEGEGDARFDSPTWLYDAMLAVHGEEKEWD